MVITGGMYDVSDAWPLAGGDTGRDFQAIAGVTATRLRLAR